MGPFYVMTWRKATNFVGEAYWPESAGMCETWQARVCPNWLCDFCTYFQARMRVFVFATYSSLKHVNPSAQLMHKDTKACCIATRHTARPYGLHMLPVLPSSGNMALEILLLLAAPAMGQLLPPHPAPTPRQLEIAIGNIQARLWTLPLAQGHGRILGHDFRRSRKLAR